MMRDDERETIYHALALARRYVQQSEPLDDHLSRQTIKLLADACELMFQSCEEMRRTLEKVYAKHIGKGSGDDY